MQCATPLKRAIADGVKWCVSDFSLNFLDTVILSVLNGKVVKLLDFFSMAGLAGSYVHLQLYFFGRAST